MATALVVPKNSAADIDDLANNLEAQANISDATEVIDVPEVNRGRMAVRVTGASVGDIEAAIATVIDCEVLPGTSIES